MRTVALAALLLGFGMNLRAQIRQIEYFWDVDKGPGKNTLVNLNAATAPSFDLNVSMQGLSRGYHLLNLRSRDAQGRWSHTQTRLVNVLTGAVPAKIVRLDYAYSQAGKVVGPYSYRVPNPAASVQLTLPGDLSALTPGQTYTLSIWATDENGVRSQVYSQAFTYRAVDCKNLAVAIQGTPSFCTGSTTALTATVSGGNAPVGLAWTRAGVEVGRTAGLTGLTQAGNYSVQATDAQGCVASASATVVQHPTPATPGVSASAASIVTGQTAILQASVAAGLSLQWLLNGSPLAGASQASYAATQGGAYTLRVTNAEGCTATSLPVSIALITAIEPVPGQAFELSVAPNPSQGAVEVRLRAGSGTAQAVTLSVTDLTGRRVYQKDVNLMDRHTEQLDLSKLPPGLYLLRATTPAQGATLRLLRQ